MKDIYGSKRDKSTQEEIRLFAVKAVIKGIMTQAETARFYKVLKGAISNWLKKYRHGG